MTAETLTPTVNSAWRLDVDTSATETPTWVQVRAANNISPTVNNTVQDATDYDAEGWGSDAVTLRKWQIAAGLLRKSAANGSYDPGQEALRAAAEALETVHVRWYDRSSALGEAYEGHALVQWAPAGGGAEGLQLVNVTLLGQGVRTVITNPSNTAEPPVITAATPSAAATGDQVIIKGGNFTGATDVDFGATAATEFVVVDSATIVAVMPTGSAGAANVVVTTAAGASAAFSYTRG